MLLEIESTVPGAGPADKESALTRVQAQFVRENAHFFLTYFCIFQMTGKIPFKIN